MTPQASPTGRMFNLSSRPHDRPLEFRRDKESGLPLASEAGKILRLVLNYLPLPYSVVEYGCGQKASIMLRCLALHHGMAPHVLQRGLVLERDLSPGALEETDFRKRPHALTLPNNLALRADLDDPTLRRLAADTGIAIEPEGATIEAGGYTLQHDETVQFVRARSHVFVVLTLWDERRGEPVRRALDPTVDRRELFPLAGMRRALGAGEALVFTAPLMGSFRLDPASLTGRQRHAVGSLLGDTGALPGLSPRSHAALVRQLTGAPQGSIGDPETWTYGNNIFLGHDRPAYRRLLEDTGRGDPARGMLDSLLEARAAGDPGRAAEALRALRELADELGLLRVLHDEADRCERELEPLADIAITIAYHHSLRHLSAAIASGRPIGALATVPGQFHEMHGVGARLRRRIERAAALSTDPDGRIDARALNPQFRRVALDAIRQMNEAGLTVCVDRAGNLHGLGGAAAPDGTGDLAGRLRGAVGFCGHLDTVWDGGKYEGRLGAFAGVEIAHLLHDLERYFEVSARGAGNQIPMVVSFFIGGEMTFSGLGVSFPGSAAVAGRATTGQVDAMTNPDGLTYREALIAFLRDLRRAARSGAVALANPFAQSTDDDALLDACFPAAAFFTPHSYERHVDHGSRLAHLGIPVAVADAVVGLWDGDVTCTGARAEEAALELVPHLRSLTERRSPFRHLRVTASVLRALGEAVRHDGPGFALSLRLGAGGIGSDEPPRDPALDAAGLAQAFRDTVAELGRRHGERWEARVGELRFLPGTNRNAGPSQVELTLALGSRLPPDVADDLADRVGEALAAMAPARGETEAGADAHLTVRESFETAPGVRLSLCYRGPEAAVLSAFGEAVGSALGEIEARFGVRARLSARHELPPVRAAGVGPLLQIERSVGGPHSPRETELAADLLRGTLFQLAVVVETLRQPQGTPPDLYATAIRLLPTDWQAGTGFVSDAMHDIGNIALAATREP